jgi:hypothetical protein
MPERRVNRIARSCARVYERNLQRRDQPQRFALVSALLHAFSDACMDRRRRGHSLNDPLSTWRTLVLVELPLTNGHVRAVVRHPSERAYEIDRALPFTDSAYARSGRTPAGLLESSSQTMNRVDSPAPRVT